MIVKELKRLFTRKMIHRRVFSSLLAMLLVITSVIHPINMVPVYATSNWLRVNYQEQAKEDVEIYVQAEDTSFEPGETIVLDVFVQNNSSEFLKGSGLSIKGDTKAFSETEFILTEACGDASISDKGTVINLDLAPGETKALQFEGTLEDGLEALDRKEIRFFYGAHNESEEVVTATTEYQFTVGLFNELSIDFTDGKELIPEETNTIEITMGLNDLGYYYETDVATDSNAEVATDSDTNVETDSDAELATDSNAEADNTYVFDITGVTLNLETAGVKFEHVKLEESSVSEENGTITALVSYEVAADAEPGEYFGTLTASVANGSKTYKSETAFQFEVVDAAIANRIKKSGLFTAELENFTVHVDVAAGAFDEKVELVVTELAEDSEEFKTAEAAMENHDREYDGMMALDICFINGAGKEVEPNEGYSVQVSIEMKAEVLPEGIDTESLMVHHIAETTTDDVQAEVVVEDVADTADATAGIVEVKEVDEAPVVAAEFSVVSFSTFTITWSGGNTLDLQLIDTKGISIGTATKGTGTLSNPLTISENTHNISGYRYVKAVVSDTGENAVKTGTTIQRVRYNSGNWQYSTSSYDYGNYTQWENLERNHVYLVYKDTRIQIVNEEDIASPKVTVKLFNYNENINKAALGQNGYQFYSYDSNSATVDEKVDKSGKYTGTTMPEMDNVLTKGYPNTEIGSMSYLFDDTAVNGKTVVATLQNGGGLFQNAGNGYYEYDSSKNAAYYDSTAGKFVLYEDAIVRPSYVNKNNDPILEGNFLPFNKLDNEGSDSTLSSSNIRDYNGISGYQLSAKTDLWFGMVVEFEFMMPKGGLVNGQPMKFEFMGDDDVFVFIDNKLVLDIGGCHEAQSGEIDFASGAVSDPTGNKTLNNIFGLGNKDAFEDYTIHTLKFFYLERGGTYSYCKLRYNMPALPQKSLTVTKELISEDSAGNAATQEYIANSVKYKFRVINADETPATPYVPKGVTYDILVGDKKIGTGTTEEGGYFYLKAGQSAQFENMLQYDATPNDSNIPKYVVEELMEEGIKGQYNGVQFEINGDGGSTVTEGTPSGDFVSFKTKPLSADETQYAFYRNKLDISELSSLSITKKAETGSQFDSDRKFDITVKLGDVLIPVGTTYQLNGVERQVETAGIIPLRINDTAIILNGIIAGTKYEVSEEDGAGYTATYSGYVTSISDKIDPEITLKNVTGEITPGDTVYVTVTNADYDFHTDIKISKEFLYNTKERTFVFKITQVNKDNQWSPVVDAKVIPDTQITVKDASVKEQVIKFGYGTDAKTGDYYYRVSEKNTGISGIVYDESFYIIKIHVDAEKNTATLLDILKNGSESLGNEAVAAFINKSAVSVTVTKTVTGGLGDINKAFEFDSKVVLDDGTTYSSETFWLAHNDVKELKNIPLETKLQIQEKNAERYTTTVTVGGREIAAVNGVYTVDINTGDIVIAVENNKEAVPDTGISMDTLPYILIMLAVIGGIVFTVIRKRKDDDLD